MEKFEIATAITKLAYAIDNEAAAGKDATGGRVGCLIEAGMSVTAGLCRLADAIEHLACAIEEKGDSV